MAAIAGQPTANPRDLASPVPGATASSAFDAAETGMAQAATPQQGSTASAFDSAETGTTTGQAAAAPVGYQGPGAGALQTVADWAPAVGGLAGGIAGIPGDALTLGGSTVLGAAAGGVGGQSLKRLIEVNILGKQPGNEQQELTDSATSGVKEGLGAMFGLGLAKGATSLAATKAGGAILDGVANLAAKPLAIMKGQVQEIAGKYVEPITRMIADKATTLNTEQAGDAVKQLFSSDIQSRFGKFVNAYSTLDNVAKEIPVFTPGQPNFFVSDIKDWAQKEFVGDNRRMLSGLADDFKDISNGGQFTNMIKDISGKMRNAYGDGLTAQGDALKALRNKAESFFEDHTEALAERVSKGTGSMQEMDAFGKMMGAQANPTTQVATKNLEDYTKSVAKDYLEIRDTVKAAYAKFRGFLSDVGEQTKINADSRGPLQFLKDIQDVPSEKLVERMFDPKNAAALRAMQTETPQVFKQVVESKMSQVVQKSSPNGELDLMAFRREINKMPGASREMLLNSQEFSQMNSLLSSPKYQAIKALGDKADKGILSWAAQMTEIARMGGKSAGNAAAQAFANSPVAKQVVGKAVASPLVDAFGPKANQ